MSTEIPPLGIDSSPLWLYGTAEARGDVAVQTRDSGATVGRAAFLAAVAAECGVIIIDRADLPEVTGVDGIRYRFPDGLMRVQTNDDHWRLARAHIAAALHDAAHPPVDEADVNALARAYHPTTDHARDGGQFAEYICNCVTVARRLLSTGRVEVKR